MTETSFLVASAMDTVGKMVAMRLLERSRVVRVLARRSNDSIPELQALGANVIFADIFDPDAMAPALAGITNAYFFHPNLATRPHIAAQFGRLASRAGVAAIVNVSQVTARSDTRSPNAQSHWRAERLLDTSGVAVTHIRPTHLADWLLDLAPMIRRGEILAPFGVGRHAPIVAEDLANVIVSILEDPAPHANRTYPLHGPAEYSWPEIASCVSSVLGRQVAYQQVDTELFDELLDEIDRGELSQQPWDVLDHSKGFFAGRNSLIQEIAESEPTTIEEFVWRHRAELA
jgi:NAD(P)H dehydrogenase (quinone)